MRWSLSATAAFKHCLYAKTFLYIPLSTLCVCVCAHVLVRRVSYYRGIVGPSHGFGKISVASASVLNINCYAHLKNVFF